MRIFDEIERCTFWNEFMFFSARLMGELKGKRAINKIQVAKLNSKGYYSYFGEVQNSENLYGPCVNSNLNLLYWYQNLHVINETPFKEKLILNKNTWSLKGRKYKWFIFLKPIVKKKSKSLIKNLKNKIKKFLKNFYSGLFQV